MDVPKILQWLPTHNRAAATLTSIARKVSMLAKKPGGTTSPVETIIREYPNANTRLDMLYTILALNTNCDYVNLTDEEVALAKKHSLLAKQEKQENYEAREKRETDVEWADVLALENTILNPRDRLIFLLYTRIPPQRNADYASVRIIREEEDRNSSDNIFVRSECAIYLKGYKTASHYGEKKISLPQEICDLIPEQNYVFQKKNGQPLGCSEMSAHTTRVFSALGQNVGAVTLRRSYASHQMKTMSREEFYERAHDLDHTPAVHRYYAFRS